MNSGLGTRVNLSLPWRNKLLLLRSRAPKSFGGKILRRRSSESNLRRQRRLSVLFKDTMPARDFWGRDRGRRKMIKALLTCQIYVRVPLDWVKRHGCLEVYSCIPYHIGGSLWVEAGEWWSDLLTEMDSELIASTRFRGPRFPGSNPKMETDARSLRGIYFLETKSIPGWDTKHYISLT